MSELALIGRLRATELQGCGSIVIRSMRWDLQP
jgi:hypothetical protein